MSLHAIIAVPHHQRPEAQSLAAKAAAWCAERGIEFWLAHGDAEHLDLPHLGDHRPASSSTLVLSLGGDGTMLRSVAALEGAPVPLLGVNIGSLGYLTEIEPDEMLGALDRFALGPEAGEWRLDERMLLDVAVNGEYRGRALNEAVIEKDASGHTVRLLARLDGDPFTHYEADGLIVSTPTGSTAYSLSARGPVVSPRHRAMMLTPVAPHMLFDRTIVLDPSEVVEIEVAGFRDANVVIDGQPRGTLAPGDVVSCRPAAETARFVRFGAYRYHQILKSKFGLADR
jgi:NAD+ kinase